MIINIVGNKREFYCNIAIEGENASVVMQDFGGISMKQGKVAIKGDDKSMIKTKTIETTEKYDRDGKLVEKIIREETSEDTTDYANEYKCELKAEDIIKVMNDYTKRTGRPILSF